MNRQRRRQIGKVQPVCAGKAHQQCHTVLQELRMASPYLTLAAPAVASYFFRSSDHGFALLRLILYEMVPGATSNYPLSLRVAALAEAELH